MTTDTDHVVIDLSDIPLADLLTGNPDDDNAFTAAIRRYTVPDDDVQLSAFNSAPR